MKTRIAMMAVTAIMAIQFIAAGEPAKRFTSDEKIISYATKNLLVALRTTNSGVIEAGMRVTAQMKMRYPAADVSELVTVLNKIWKNNPSGTIRYKAYITMSICENPEWYSADIKVATADDLTFFRAASSRLQEQLLSANVH